MRSLDMKKIIVFLMLLYGAVAALAQKNLVPASLSQFTGIDLPAGTRQDKRIFNSAVVSTFLEGETKKFNVKVIESEVFRLSPGINHTAALMGALRTKGWDIRPLDNRPEWAWVMRSGESLIMYWSGVVNNPELYFGRTDAAPMQPTTVPVVADKVTTEEPAVVAAPPADQLPVVSTPPPPGQSTTAGTFTFTRTNWDDGWVSTIEEDRVVVVKGNIQVFVFFPIPYTDASRHVGRDFFWDNHLARQMRILTKQYRDHGEVMSSFQAPYIEGTGIDPKTGGACFIAMYVTSENGNMYPVVVLTPDEATLRNAFPNAEKQFDSELPGLSRYNRFAVALPDLVGQWNGGGGTAMNYYNAYTGAYAGMAAVAMSDKFQFMANGDYTSSHKGASGMVGSMATYSQEYRGKATIDNWSATFTNRWQGKTEEYSAWLEAVRGGRVLVLQSKTGALRYNLVRE